MSVDLFFNCWVVIDIELITDISYSTKHGFLLHNTTLLFKKKHFYDHVTSLLLYYCIKLFFDHIYSFSAAILGLPQIGNPKAERMMSQTEALGGHLHHSGQKDGKPARMTDQNCLEDQQVVPEEDMILEIGIPLAIITGHTAEGPGMTSALAKYSDGWFYWFNFSLVENTCSQEPKIEIILEFIVYLLVKRS